MNNVVLIGRLCKDFELRFTSSGKAVATSTVAVNRPFSKNKEADFIPIVAWNKTAENSANNTGKGKLIGVQGRIQTRSYDDSQGNKRYVTEIVADQVEFLEWGNREGQTPSNDTTLDDFEQVDDNDCPF